MEIILGSKIVQEHKLITATDDKLIYEDGTWCYKKSQNLYRDNPDNFMWSFDKDTKEMRLIPTFKPR